MEIKVEKSYHANGIIKRRYLFNKHNNFHGLHQYISKNGNLFIETIYQNSLKHSHHRIWHDHGQLESERLYKNGHLYSIERCWNRQGSLINIE